MKALLLWALLSTANPTKDIDKRYGNCEHEEWFVCSDGSGCNHREQFCDGEHSFCSDGSDEILYNETIHTEKDGVPCRGWTDLTRICLLPASISDKASSICNDGQKCEVGLFRCSDLSKCISTEDYCNGYPDCKDGSDEIKYDSGIHTEEDGVPCYNSEWDMPRCLLPPGNNYICDAGAAVECDENQFSCDYDTKCIEAGRFCDGKDDCSDGADEIQYDPGMSDYGVSCQNKHSERFCLLPREYDASEMCFNVQKDCRPEWFVCASGTACFPRKGFCDGDAMCSDGSDEVMYNRRIHRKRRDGIACRGWSDLNKFCLLQRGILDREKYICNKDKKCDIPAEYRCADGSACISKESYCDGFPDCKDGSDEIVYDSSVHGFQDGAACFMNDRILPTCFLPAASGLNPREFCDKVECTKDSFKCADGSKCISMRSFCDGRTDCPDGSDETPYDVAIHTDGTSCHPRFSGRTCFLPLVYGSVSRCFNVETDCMDEWFVCSDKKNCVHKESFCDGEHNYCEDGSDEVPYNASIHSEKDGIPCRGWRDLTRVCLLPAAMVSRADSICNKEQSCLLADFRCSDKSKCISKEDYCDGYDNCSDGSDEIVFDPDKHTEKDGISCYIGEWERKPCLLPPGNIFLCDHVQCEANEYNCANAVECIPGENFCDLKPDCSDGSDEVVYDPELHSGYLLCRSHVKVDHICTFESWVFDELCNRDCTMDSFMCEDKSKCIPKEKFCDAIKDCPDGSDEVRYKEYIGTDAIRCTSWTDVRRHCVLPKSQSDKKDLVCNIAEECPADTFKCTHGRQCIPAEEFCDGVKDCRDGSDEIAFSPLEQTLQDGVSCKRKNGRKCLIPSKFSFNSFWTLACEAQ